MNLRRWCVRVEEGKGSRCMLDLVRVLRVMSDDEMSFITAMECSTMHCWISSEHYWIRLC